MPKARLTDLSVKNLRPMGEQVIYWCDKTPNFGIRVSQKGTKTFLVLQGTHRKKISIGRYPQISLKEARQQANRLLTDPIPSFSATTTLEACTVYLDIHVYPNYSPHWAKLTAGILSKHLKELHNVPVSEVELHHLTYIIDKMAETPSAANHAHAVFKTFFAWCATRRLISHSPLQGVPKPHRETARARTLSDDEVAALWEATHEHTPYYLLLRTLLTTGQRVAQISHLKDNWIDFDKKLITFPAEIMKNKKDHILPFGNITHYILLGAIVVDGYFFSAVSKPGKPFSAWSHYKKQLDNKLQFTEHFTLHDIRRTWATIAARLDIQPHVIEKVLSHTTGSLSPIASIYNRYSYLPDMRIAIERVEKHVLEVVKPPDSAHDSQV